MSTTNSASALARALPSSLSSRTLFIKCDPPPVNLAERRAVLKTLTSMVEIETFKRLKDSSSFIAVTSKPEMAENVIQNTPMKRTLLIQNSTATASFSTTSWGTAFRRTITDPINPLPPGATHSSACSDDDTNSSSSEPSLPSRSFVISAFPANFGYKHKRIIGIDVLHGPWPKGAGERQTFISAALRKTVPSGPMAGGLRDWETGRQGLGGSSRGFERGSAEELVRHIPQGSAFIEERKWKREMQEKTPAIMKGLYAIAQEQRERAVVPFGRVLRALEADKPEEAQRTVVSKVAVQQRLVETAPAQEIAVQSSKETKPEVATQEKTTKDDPTIESATVQEAAETGPMAQATAQDATTEYAGRNAPTEAKPRSKGNKGEDASLDMTSASVSNHSFFQQTTKGVTDQMITRKEQSAQETTQDATNDEFWIAPPGAIKPKGKKGKRGKKGKDADLGMPSASDFYDSFFNK